MTSIRLLSDGDRFYIVIDHPTEDEKKAAMDFVSERMGIQNIKEETPKGVLPVNVESYTIPENLKDVKKEKLQIKVINTVEEFIDWFQMYPTLDPYNKKKLKNQLNFYIKNKINKIESIDDIKMFLMNYKPILNTQIEEILKKNGYNDLNTFLNAEGEQNITAVFNTCKEFLVNSIK